MKRRMTMMNMMNMMMNMMMEEVGEKSGYLLFLLLALNEYEGELNAP